MKKIFVIIVVLFVIIGAGFLVVNFILTKRLPEIVNKWIIPKVEESTGLQVAISDAKLHLIGGEMSISQLDISNPAITKNKNILSAKEFVVDFDVLPLLRKQVNINSLYLNDIAVNINRDRNGRMNFNTEKPESEQSTVEQKSTQSESGQVSAADIPEKTSSVNDAPGESSPLNLSLNNFKCTAVITYSDDKISEPPFKLPFDVALSADNIKTTGSADDKWGTFHLTGGMKGKPEVFTTDISGRIAPVTDKDEISMNFAGTIKNIKLSELGPYTNKMDISAENIDAEIKFKSVAGKIDPLNSKLTLIMQNVTLSGKLEQKTKNITLPPNLKINVPIKGTINQPQVDIMSAIITTVMKNLGGSLGTMLENTTINGKKLDGNAAEAAKLIGNFLKGL